MREAPLAAHHRGQHGRAGRAHLSAHEDGERELTSTSRSKRATPSCSPRAPFQATRRSVYRNIDNLFKAGAKVIYNRLAPVHVRGHAAREELKIVHMLVQPQYFVGIHGEHRHLVLHRELAIELGTHPDDAFVLSDGDVLEITEDEAEVVDRVPADYVYVDGLGVGDIDRIVLRDRQHLASDGMVRRRCGDQPSAR